MQGGRRAGGRRRSARGHRAGRHPPAGVRPCDLVSRQLGSSCSPSTPPPAASQQPHMPPHTSTHRHAQAMSPHLELVAAGPQIQRQRPAVALAPLHARRARAVPAAQLRGRPHHAQHLAKRQLAHGAEGDADGGARRAAGGRRGAAAQRVHRRVRGRGGGGGRHEGAHALWRGGAAPRGCRQGQGAWRGQGPQLVPDTPVVACAAAVQGGGLAGASEAAARLPRCPALRAPAAAWDGTRTAGVMAEGAWRPTAEGHANKDMARRSAEGRPVVAPIPAAGCRSAYPRAATARVGRAGGRAPESGVVDCSRACGLCWRPQLHPDP